MAIEIVDFPMNSMVIFQLCNRLPEGKRTVYLDQRTCYRNCWVSGVSLHNPFMNGISHGMGTNSWKPGLFFPVFLAKSTDWGIVYTFLAINIVCDRWFSQWDIHLWGSVLCFFWSPRLANPSIGTPWQDRNVGNVPSWNHFWHFLGGWHRWCYQQKDDKKNSKNEGFFPSSRGCHWDLAVGWLWTSI